MQTNIRQTLQKRREERHEPPPVAIALPDNEKVRNLCVKPHALNQYDHIDMSPQATEPVNKSLTCESKKSVKPENDQLKGSRQ